MKEKRLPTYHEQTTKHLEMLNHYTSEIRQNGVENLKLDNNLNKPSINDLSQMGNRYCDFLDGCGEVDYKYWDIVNAEVALIDICLKKRIFPNPEWFKSYHAEYSHNKISGYYIKDLLLSSELVSWLKGTTQSPEKTKWLEFVSKDELALKKRTKEINFFPTPFNTIINKSFHKKNIF